MGVKHSGMSTGWLRGLQALGSAGGAATFRSFSAKKTVSVFLKPHYGNVVSFSTNSFCLGNSLSLLLTERYGGIFGRIFNILWFASSLFFTVLRLGV